MCALLSMKQDQEPQRQTLPLPWLRYWMVSPRALSVSDIDPYGRLLHTLFTLEDNDELKISAMDGEVCQKVDVRKSNDAAWLHEKPFVV